MVPVSCRLMVIKYTENGILQLEECHSYFASHIN